jgi:hypothetical protein
MIRGMSAPNFLGTIVNDHGYAKVIVRNQVEYSLCYFFNLCETRTMIHAAMQRTSPKSFMIKDRYSFRD